LEIASVVFDWLKSALPRPEVWGLRPLVVSDSSMADLPVINGIPTLVSKHTGTVRVRARFDDRSAEATVNVITPEEMKPGTILWQAPSIPGHKPIQIVPAVPSSGTRPGP
jgi:hypothetical protein